MHNQPAFWQNMALISPSTVATAFHQLALQAKNGSESALEGMLCAVRTLDDEFFQQPLPAVTAPKRDGSPQFLANHYLSKDVYVALSRGAPWARNGKPDRLNDAEWALAQSITRRLVDACNPRGLLQTPDPLDSTMKRDLNRVKTSWLHWVCNSFGDIRDERLRHDILGAMSDGSLVNLTGFEVYRRSMDSDEKVKATLLGSAIFHNNVPAMQQLKASLPNYHAACMTSCMELGSKQLDALEVAGRYAHVDTVKEVLQHRVSVLGHAKLVPVDALKVLSSHMNGRGELEKRVLNGTKKVYVRHDEELILLCLDIGVKLVIDAFPRLGGRSWSHKELGGPDSAKIKEMLDAISVRAMKQLCCPVVDALAKYIVNPGGDTKAFDKPFNWLLNGFDDLYKSPNVRDFKEVFLEDLSKCVASLQAAGANINMDKGSALMLAVKGSFPLEKSRVLLALGADPTVKDERGWTAASHIGKEHSKEMRTDFEAFHAALQAQQAVDRMHISPVDLKPL